ncbi:MAG: KEOPS complex subunit Pcc1 [Candidatus Bathyarchaeia archaeon]
MRAKAAVRLRFSSEAQLAALVDALKPEVQRRVGFRSKASLGQDGLFLVLDVEAEDTVALRAALNAYLRWINSTMNVLEAVESRS